jgi:hypothetical protein
VRSPQLKIKGGKHGAQCSQPFLASVAVPEKREPQWYLSWRAVERSQWPQACIQQVLNKHLCPILVHSGPTPKITANSSQKRQCPQVAKKTLAQKQTHLVPFWPFFWGKPRVLSLNKCDPVRGEPACVLAYHWPEFLTGSEFLWLSCKPLQKTFLKWKKKVDRVLTTIAAKLSIRDVVVRVGKNPKVS